MNVYVVHGPPLSGKSTYVQEHKGPNDLVFDFDLIMSALSGLPVHQHNENLIGYVLDIRDLIINRPRQRRPDVIKNEKWSGNSGEINTETTGICRYLYRDR